MITRACFPTPLQAFKRFEEKMLPELKLEYPTLRRSQINEMISRKWERSSENPVRMARLEGRG